MMNIIVNSQVIDELKRSISSTELLLNVRISFKFKDLKLIHSVYSQLIL